MRGAQAPMLRVAPGRRKSPTCFPHPPAHAAPAQPLAAESLDGKDVDATQRVFLLRLQARKRAGVAAGGGGAPAAAAAVGAVAATAPAAGSGRPMPFESGVVVRGARHAGHR